MGHTTQLNLSFRKSFTRAGDLSRVNQAFFTMNGLASLTFLAAVLVESLASGA